MADGGGDLATAIPDLRAVPADRLAEVGAALDDAIRLYRQRLKENGEPLSSFNARI